MAADQTSAVRVVMPVQDVAHTMKAARLLYSAPSFILRGPIYMIFIITFAAVVYSFFGRVDKLVTCRLELRADVTKIQAPRRGTVRQIFVTEGSQIKSFTPLAEVQLLSGATEDSEDAQLKKELEKIDVELDYAGRGKQEQEQRIKNMEQELEELSNKRKDLDTNFQKDKASNENMLKDATEQISICDGVVRQAGVNRDSLRRNVTAALDRAAKAKQRHDEEKKLFEEKKVTIMELRQFEDALTERNKEVNDARSGLEKAELEVMNAESNLRKAQTRPEELRVQWGQRETRLRNDQADLEARKRARESDINLAKLALNKDFEKLRKRRAEVEEKLKKLGVTNEFGVTFEGEVCKISSTYGGTVTNVYAKRDQQVGSGEVLFSIVRDTASVYASILVPNRDIGRVKMGQKVNIKYDAFPYQDFSIQTGTISYIGTKPAEGDKMGQYEVQVSLTRQTMVKERETLPAANTVGKTLGADYTVKDSRGDELIHTDGTPVTQAVKEDLERAGINEVKVVSKEEPLALGLQGFAEIKTGEKRLIEILFTPVSKWFAASGD